jgi:GNAT superfamily N-acetyltransferase
MVYEVRRGDYLISTDRSLLNIDAIHAFLTNSYWANGVPRDVVAASIENSLSFGLHVNGRQIGFARVVSDCATLAYLADVYVEEPYRGQGLSKLLMRAVLDHPDLRGLRRWILGTADAHALYEQFGFVPLVKPERWMELADPDIYKGRSSR